MLTRRHIEHFDWILLVTALALAGLGILTIYSVTYDVPGFNDYQKQILWVAIGFLVMLAAAAIPYQFWVKIAPGVYGLAMILLLYLLVFGRSELEVRRWIPIWKFRFQPSELAKIAIILMLGRWIARFGRAAPTLKDLVVPAAIATGPLLLILLQPDLGTALIIVPIFAALVFVSGYNMKRLIIIGVTASVLAGVLGPRILKPYQWRRITSFLHPESDPLGSGYHLIQSKIAIGSGGFWGKGFRSGTQSQLDFLPVQDTDFIFAVWGEERGFAGALVLLVLFMLLLVRILAIARNAADLNGTFICVGFAVMLFFQIVINTGMVIGLMPITGLPLPFMSYGGSACIINFLIIGVTLSIGMRRFADYSI